MEIDYVGQIQLLEMGISDKEISSSIMLVNQTFIDWYLLVEGNNSLDELKLQSILNRNIIIINKIYPTESKLMFLIGWMIQISPWFFDQNESDKGEKFCFKHWYNFRFYYL